jgi:hypothetical protein
MHAYQFSSMTELHEKLTRNLVLAQRKDLDVITTADVQVHNVIASAKTMDWDFDLKWLWLTQSRWGMMVRQYIPPGDFVEWIEKITKHIGVKGRGIALLRTRSVAARGGAKKGNQETRRWGSCMLGISYKALPQPQITLYSRTCYLGYLSGLDLSVAWWCGKYVANELGVDVEDFKFVWMNEALQYHNFKSLAYLLNNPDSQKRKEYRTLLRASDHKLKDLELYDFVQERPALLLSRKWLKKIILADQKGESLGDMTYNTYRRIRRRYHTEVLGYEKAQEFEGWSLYKTGPNKGQPKEYFKAYQPLPSVSIKDLDFSPINIPFVNGGHYGATLIKPANDSWLDEDDD